MRPPKPSVNPLLQVAPQTGIMRGMDTKTFNALQAHAARERLQCVLRLRKRGDTWAAIGAALGISRQRAAKLGAKAEARYGRAK